MKSISFFVPGVPGTAGSKKFVGMAKSTGRAIIVDSSGVKGKTWRLAVQYACMEMMRINGIEKFEKGALCLSVSFNMPRPKHHFNSKGATKQTSPLWHTSKPDATKMLRAVEDALNGILWNDDSNIATQSVRKWYAINPGAEITVKEIQP